MSHKRARKAEERGSSSSSHSVESDPDSAQPRPVKRVRAESTEPTDLVYEDEARFVFQHDTQYLLDAYADSEAERRKRMRGVTSEEAMESAEEAGKNRVTGDIQFREFMANFGMFKMVRYAPQMEVVRACQGILIRQMFGDQFELHKERIMREYGIKDFRGEVMVTMPRRRGKTQIVAAIEASASVVIGGATVLFASVFQQASDLLQLIHDFILQLPDGKQMVTQKNSRRMTISKKKQKNDPNAGVIRAYAGNTNSARGFKASRIHVDEAGFVKTDFIVKNIFAGMLLAATMLVMISSPPIPDSPFHRLCEAANSRGEKMFKRIRIDLMCDDCRKVNKLKTTCKHVILPNAPWLAEDEQQETIRVVMSDLDPVSYRQEIMGITESTEVECFPEIILNRLRCDPRLRFTQPPEYILIGVDPSGLGSSETAVCAMAMNSQGEHVIVGLETVGQSAYINVEKELQRFCDMLVTQEWNRRKSKIIFFSESNYGGPTAAASLYRSMARWAKASGVELYALADECQSNPRPGFWLNAHRKEAMMRYTREIMEKGRLRMLDHIVSSTMTDPLNKLLEQARNYSRRFKQATRFESEEPKQSSVLSGKSAGRTDDLIIIMQQTAWLLPQVMEGSAKFILQRGEVITSDPALTDVEFHPAMIKHAFSNRRPMSEASRDFPGEDEEYNMRNKSAGITRAV